MSVCSVAGFTAQRFQFKHYFVMENTRNTIKQKLKRALLFCNTNLNMYWLYQLKIRFFLLIFVDDGYIVW